MGVPHLPLIGVELKGHRPTEHWGTLLEWHSAKGNKPLWAKKQLQQERRKQPRGRRYTKMLQGRTYVFFPSFTFDSCTRLLYVQLFILEMYSILSLKTLERVTKRSTNLLQLLLVWCWGEQRQEEETGYSLLQHSWATLIAMGLGPRGLTELLFLKSNRHRCAEKREEHTTFPTTT